MYTEKILCTIRFPVLGKRLVLRVIQIKIPHSVLVDHHSREDFQYSQKQDSRDDQICRRYQELFQRKMFIGQQYNIGRFTQKQTQQG